MKIVKDEKTVGCYDLQNLTSSEIGTIRRALERYGTPMATEIYVSLRQGLISLGECPDEKTNGNDKGEAGKERTAYAVPLIICRT